MNVNITCYTLFKKIYCYVMPFFRKTALAICCFCLSHPVCAMNDDLAITADNLALQKSASDNGQRNQVEKWLQLRGSKPDLDQGVKLLRSQCSEQDYDRARQLLEKVAAQNDDVLSHAWACFYLATMHYFGQRVPKDELKVKEWLRKAEDTNIDGAPDAPRLINCKKSCILDLSAAVDTLRKCGRSYELHVGCILGQKKLVQELLQDESCQKHIDTFYRNRSPLMWAIWVDDKEVVELLLKAGASPEKRENPLKLSPLLYTAAYGCTQMVDILISAGASLYKTIKGLNALHCAIIYGHKDLVRSLLERGTNVESETEEGFTPLHLACNSLSCLSEAQATVLNEFVDVRELVTTIKIAIAQLLLAHKAKVKAATKDSKITALHLAANDKAVTEFLVKNGAVSTRAKDYETPFDYALLWGNNDVVKHYIAAGVEVRAGKVIVGGDAEQRIKKFVSPIHSAAKGGSLEVMKTLCATSAKGDVNVVCDRETPLHVAAQHGHADCIRFLFDSGAELNAIQDGTPLFVAAYHRQNDSLKTLLELGADPDGCINQVGWRSPILIAVSLSNKRAVELLIAYKADLNVNAADDRSDFTPLHWCAYNGDAEIAELLLIAHAFCNPSDAHGMTPLHVALQKNLYKNSNGSFGWSHVDVIKQLIAHGANVNAVIFKEGLNQGYTPLHFAAVTGNKEVVALLLAKGAVEAVDIAGNTPVHIAARYGHKEIVEMLLSHGFRAKLINNEGMTAIHLAVQNERKDLKELVMLLLSNGVAADRKDKQGKLASDYSTNDEIKALLSKK